MPLPDISQEVEVLRTLRIILAALIPTVFAIGSSLASANALAPQAAAVNFPKLTPFVVLYNVSNDRCADIPNFGKGSVGQPVNQFACRPGDYDNQQVRIVRVGDYGRFLIQTRVNGSGGDALCYDLPDYGSVPQGTRVSLYHCRPYNDNQLFYLRQVGNAFQIVHNITGMCLDVTGYRSNALDAPLMLWPCNANDDHMWWLRNPATTPVQPLPAAKSSYQSSIPKNPWDLFHPCTNGWHQNLPWVVPPGSIRPGAGVPAPLCIEKMYWPITRPAEIQKAATLGWSWCLAVNLQVSRNPSWQLAQAEMWCAQDYRFWDYVQY